MIPQLLNALLLAMLAAPESQPSLGCTDSELKSLDLGARMVARGDDLMYHQAAEKGTSGPNARCVWTKLSRSSLLGWIEARKLAVAGGALELQGPASRSLKELEQLKGGSIDLDVEYAQIAIRAALAASQDERAELELLLTHARDLSERLLARGRRAVWPRPYNILAGELWFEVDRYEDARAAFERSAKADGSAIARVGLARALARLGRPEEACEIYRNVRDATTILREAAHQDLAGCQ